MSNINNQLNNKTAFITGATFGIGEGVAKYLASVGLNIVIFGRSQENGKRVEKEINELKVGRSLFVQGDATSETDVKRALEEGEKTFGSINFVFANAGILGEKYGLLDAPIEEIRKVFEINFFGALVTFQQSAAFLKKAGGGAIVFNSSFFGAAPKTYFVDGGFYPVYSISKTALDGVVKVATSLQKSNNIRVYSVNPSIFSSGMTNNEGANSDQIAQFLNLLIKKGGNPTDIGRVLEHLFDGSTKYLNGTGIICENNVTFSTQFFYDNYTTDEQFSIEDLINNHLNDAKGEKLGEKQIQEIRENLNKKN